MSSIGARALNQITVTETTGNESDFHRKLFDDLMEIMGYSETVFFLPFFETNPTATGDITDYGPHGLHFTQNGNYDTPPTIRGSVLAYDFNGLAPANEENLVHADDDLFSMGADGTAPNEPSFSLSLAFNFRGTAQKNLINKDDPITPDREFTLRIGADEKIYFYVFDDSVPAHIGRLYNTALNPNQWYRCIVTYDGTRADTGLRIYLDGVRVDDTNSSNAVYVAMENLTNVMLIGCAGSVGAETAHFDGRMGPPVVQTAKCLTPAEVTKADGIYRRLLGI